MRNAIENCKSKSHIAEVRLRRKLSACSKWAANSCSSSTKTCRWRHFLDFVTVPYTISQTYHGQTLCVLDFYVHYSRQRQGIGKHLFDFMLSARRDTMQLLESTANLQSERMQAGELALDSPSVTMLAFMAKHYSLSDPIWQNTNFVVFQEFFQIATQKGKRLLFRPIHLLKSFCSGQRRSAGRRLDTYEHSEGDLGRSTRPPLAERARTRHRLRGP